MFATTRRACRAACIAGVVGILLLGGIAPALADSTTATATVTGGSLSETNSTTPSPSVTLDGTDQTASYTLSITVTDATGTGSGWNLTITSTTFTTGGGAPHTLSTSASSITGVTAVCPASTTCTDPTNAITYPIGIPAAASAPTAVKFFNAATNTGMGQFTVTPHSAHRHPR